MLTLRIDQGRIAQWIAGHPAEVTRHNPEATPAAYPRPLAWWREFAPPWVAVTEEPGGIIVMRPARTGGPAAARRARDESLRCLYLGVRPVQAAITEEQS